MSANHNEREENAACPKHKKLMTKMLHKKSQVM